MIRDLFGDKPTFSCEFFPPKSPEGEVTLWQTIDSLSKYRPDFVSVTYGAGGSNQDTSLHVTSKMVNERGIPTLAHLTCVGRTSAELSDVIDMYAAEGVRDILALRGDPVAGAGTTWHTTPGGFTYAIELIELLRERGDFSIGVSAFPEGHPESLSLEQDARILAEKQKAGAHFAMTNLFFNAADYFRMIDDAAKFGCDMPIVPGLMPLTNVSQIQRFATLSGAAFPDSWAEKFHAIADDSAAVLSLGVEMATALARELLDGGAPGIHIYSLNKATSTARIFDNLDVATR